MFDFLKRSKAPEEKSLVERCFEEMTDNTFLSRENLLLWREDGRLTATMAEKGADGTVEIDMDLLTHWLAGSHKKLRREERERFVREGMAFLAAEGYESRMVSPLFDTMQRERKHRHF